MKRAALRGRLSHSMKSPSQMTSDGVSNRLIGWIATALIHSLRPLEDVQACRKLREWQTWPNRQSVRPELGFGNPSQPSR